MARNMLLPHMPLESNAIGYAYFGEFLPALRGRVLVPYLKALTCTFVVHVTDSGDPPWVVHVHEGRLSEPAGNTPECAFTLDSRTLRDIVTGRTRPEQAFFDMKVDVLGDMELGLKLSTVLAPFFRRFPFAGGA
jgi:predicted lipid carrier protein YhbT